MVYIGVDLGGTNIAIGIVNEKFEIIKKGSTPTLPERGGDAIIADMAALSKKLLAECGLTLDDVAYAVGLPLGVLMGWSRPADRLLAPLVYLTYPTPKIALLPVIMLLFGLGDISKTVMLFLILVFQIVIAVRDGIRAVPEEVFYPLASLGAPFRVILREVLLPASLPKFMTAIRVAMATAISVLFFTETFGTQYGMGYFIMDAWLRVNYLEMYSGIVVLSGMGLVLFVALDLAERHFCRWQYN